MLGREGGEARLPSLITSATTLSPCPTTHQCWHSCPCTPPCATYQSRVGQEESWQVLSALYLLTTLQILKQ